MSGKPLDGPDREEAQLGWAQETWKESMERMRQDRTQRATLDEKERGDEELRSLLSSA